MSNDIAPPSSYVAWGPFVRHNFKVPPVTRLDLIVSSTIFGLAILLGSCAAFIGYRQTRASRQPWRCPYVWMIWLELAASVALAMICLLFLLWVIRPSFYFYTGTFICWVVQIQMLPQIIINRICLIMQDRKKGKRLIIGSAIFITLINISVFFVWIPARLQISEEFIRINDVWDRIEKILYLLFDVYLNWYFIRVVKAELVKNGLTKYNRLVRFNKRMIVVSLLFDVLIIAAMSIPNGMVYPIFHPLAYIAKLNIEMSMAHLIRMIALDERNSNPNVSLFVASALAPDETRPITNLFSEVRMPKRALILSLFSSDPYKFVRQDAQSIEPGNISTRTTTLTDLEFKSLEHNSSTRSGCDNDDRAAHEAGLKGPVLRENIDEEMGISQQGHDLREFRQIRLRAYPRSEPLYPTHVLYDKGFWALRALA